MSRNASRSTNPNTSGATELSLSLKSFDCAVMPVTPTSAFGSAPTVVGTISSLSVASAASEAASVPLAVDGDGDGRNRPAVVHVDRDGLVHLSGGERPPLELADRLLHRGRADVGGLDDDAGRDLAPRERLLDPVVRLDRGQGLRVRLDAGLDRAQLQRRHGERQEETGREDEGDHGPAAGPRRRSFPRSGPRRHRVGAG